MLVQTTGQTEVLETGPIAEFGNGITSVEEQEAGTYYVRVEFDNPRGEFAGRDVPYDLRFEVEEAEPEPSPSSSPSPEPSPAESPSEEPSATPSASEAEDEDGGGLPAVAWFAIGGLSAVVIALVIALVISRRQRPWS